MCIYIVLCYVWCVCPRYQINLLSVLIVSFPTKGFQLCFYVRQTQRYTRMSFHVCPMILSTPGTIMFFKSLCSNFLVWFSSFISKICRADFRQSTSYWKEKLGHATIDLGIAPEKLEIYQNGDIKGTDPMERLQSIRGHLVSLPLEFMCNEDLRPNFSEGEFYASSQVFH